MFCVRAGPGLAPASECPNLLSLSLSQYELVELLVRPPMTFDSFPSIFRTFTEVFFPLKGSQ